VKDLETPQPDPGIDGHDDDRYRLLFERNLAGVFRSTTSGRILECNDAFAQIFGYESVDHVVERQAKDFYPSEAARQALMAQLEARGELHNHEMVLVRADDTPVWVLANMNLVTDEGGDPWLVEGTMVDISERKRAEDRLALQSTALESAASAIVITDPDGTIQWVNPAFSWLTGYTAEEAVGQNSRILRSDRQPESVYDELWRTINDGRVWHGELVNRRKDGELSNDEVTITPVLGAGGEIDHFIAVMQDVSDRVRMQEQLMQAQKMEAVGRLAGGVAHDFNNLLQAMLGLTALITRPGTRFDEAISTVQELEGLIHRASQLTRQLLLFSRRDTAQEETLELNAVVEETMLLLRRLLRENIEITFEPADELLPLVADRSQLEQIVMNLAVNSADAMPEGGDLKLRTGRSDTDSIWLEVADTGHGIPADIRNHLFEPFFTTKERSRGTGLGLSVVHGIVTRQGGKIQIDSEVGTGTTFRINLPAADASLTADEITGIFRIPSAGGDERILVIEDDIAVRESLAEVLAGLGYNVTAVGTCGEAESLPADSPFDLLLSDFGLPDGSGTDVAMRLLGRWPDLRVVIMSGYAEDDVIGKHTTAGDLHFIQKPFNVRTLGHTIRMVLAGKDGAPGS
jgi:PAS domain S-box-containing protein